MIQRIQSFWLLLASICSFLTYKFPFYNGPTTNGIELLDATYCIPFLILAAVLGSGCTVIIFLYKKRNLQLFLTILTLIISILNIYVYFRHIGKFNIANLSFTAVIYFAIPVLLFLALRGILKDKKLVKNLDRLR